MKTFYAVLAVFLLILLAVTGNALYVNRVAKNMHERLDHVAQASCRESLAATQELCEYWKKHCRWVECSASYPLVDRVSEASDALAAAAEAGDVFGHRQALAMLRDAINDLARPEQLRPGSLF